jgi:hypothetical protein
MARLTASEKHLMLALAEQLETQAAALDAQERRALSSHS